MASTPRTPFDPTRRRLLLAGASGLVLAACGSGGGGSAAGTTTTTTTAAPAGTTALSLVRVFSPEQAAGTPVRLPLAFADAEGIPTDEVPESIQVRATGPSGATLEPVEVGRRGTGIPSPYFPYEATFDEVGEWQLIIGVDGAETATGITVRAPHELPAVPGPGESLPSIPTPTLEDQQGVDPICTRPTICPLHGVSLDVALGRGLPVALLVSTPAFCQTAICGPVLDLAVERSATYAGRLTMIHAEVYQDGDAREVSPTVNALGLRYEPSLFLADATGTVRSRLDYTFDATELDESLEALLA